MREKKDVRLFFALWPGDATRQRLAEAVAGIPLPALARRVPKGNLHMTLHFVGNVYFDEMACMQEQARRVDAEAFKVELDCQGVFSKPRVGWLGCGAIPEKLLELHQRLGERLRDCGFRPELRRYHPHVTVARKIEALNSEAAFAPIDWPVREFALIEVISMDNGVQYRVVEKYPLA